MAENKEIVKNNDASLPAHLQGGKQSSFGNIDSSDLIIPRIKLLQSVSEELQAYDGLKPGQFWHTLLEKQMGDKLRFIPLILQKSLVLWAPRGDDRGILARSTDCRNWDSGFANLEFEVKIKGQPKPIKYYTGNNVAESGLATFGSSIPGDDQSRPAASLTYRMMFYFPDFPEASPAIIINTRSSVRAAKQLISKIEMRPVDHYGQVFIMGTTDEKGDEGPYKGYSYTADGYASEKEYADAKSMYEKFKEVEWRTNDERDEGGAIDDAAPRKGQPGARPVDDKIPF